MKSRFQFFLAALVGLSKRVRADDLFNYRESSGNDYGPEDWNKVECDKVGECKGWPNYYESSIGWTLQKNECEWCPEDGGTCGQHRQSPIDLMRDRAIPDNDNWKECPDWHWMQYQDGSCDWDDMLEQFQINRHALQIHIPINNNGDIDCVTESGTRKFPRLDYSKGFPDWWHLSRTDISVPSQHVQHGKRYAAEVVLGHFYEIDHWKNKLGKVSIFMQDYEDEAPWPFLDKLICQFRRIEEQKRSECGLDPAPVYKMCELYRGQNRTEEDLYLTSAQAGFPTVAPLVAPDPIPIEDFGGDPDPSLFPLGLCQGDCDFTTDCQSGLICQPRDAFDPVPGCIGGEEYGENSDFCVFDPYGEGYFPPTDTPTSTPTITARPSLTPLPRKNLTDYGGTPPSDAMPLGRCEGDCDTDSDCAEGLYCFQRDGYTAVPGCWGGKKYSNQTDFCVFDPYGSGYVDPKEPTGTPSQPPTQIPSLVPSKVPSQSPTAPTPQPSYFPRPVGPPKQVEDMGWEPPLPLGECEGDCDDDSDCGPGLVCFQRNSVFTAVPGCAGGETDRSLTDYCIYPVIPTTKPAVVTTPSPTGLPTLIPTKGPTQTPAMDETPKPTKSPTKSPVKSPTASPTHIPSDAPTKGSTNKPSDTQSMPTTDGKQDDDLIPIENLGWSPPLPIGRCQGDCDYDTQCGTGLSCFQRDAYFVAVPGCTGGESEASLTDYCISDSLMATNPPTADPLKTAPTTRPTGIPTFRLTSTPSVVPTSSPTLLATTLAIVPTTQPTINLTANPTLTPTEKQPTENPTSQTIDDALPALVSLGWTPPLSSRPLSMCEGDCDVDSDCGDGLICFQRYFPRVDVPGCSGGEYDTTLADFCIRDPDAPTSAPSAATPDTMNSTPSPVETNVTSVGPSSAPMFVESRLDSVPPAINCSNYGRETNFFRMCKQNSCCTDPRSATTFCEEQYGILGDDVESACYHCCMETHGVSRSVGPGPGETVDVPLAAVRTGFVCDIFNSDYHYHRMCKDDSCCTNPRSSSTFCHEQYKLLGDFVADACQNCCLEERGVALEVGPPPTVNDQISDIDCTNVPNPNRMCLANGCCTLAGSTTSWCQEQYGILTLDQLKSLCWYCCHPSFEINFNITGNRRVLESESDDDRVLTSEVNKDITAEESQQNDRPEGSRALSEEDVRAELNRINPRQLTEKDQVTHLDGRRVIVREENFEEKGIIDDDVYFEQMHTTYQRRTQKADDFKENYDDVFYWPYEWMLKVGTEYYFRYEGTQAVPPCYDTVHWRVMKDPIRVAPHQIKELERLIAWRLGDNCEVDTAGKPRDDNSGAVDVARPLQSFHRLHRMVFCECQDWPSKFPMDRLWCRNWKSKDPEERLFDNPYNWPQDGF